MRYESVDEYESIDHVSPVRVVESWAIGIDRRLSYYHHQRFDQRGRARAFLIS